MDSMSFLASEESAMRAEAVAAAGVGAGAVEELKVDSVSVVVVEEAGLTLGHWLA
jgi:hypothetical protein